MRKDIEHIDDIFKEKLVDFRSTAPDDVWDAIDVQLSNAGTKKIALFYKIAAAIAAITLIGSIYLLSTNNIENNDSYIVKNDTETKLDETVVNNSKSEEKITEKENNLEIKKEDIGNITKDKNKKVIADQNILVAKNIIEETPLKEIESNSKTEKQIAFIKRLNPIPLSFYLKTAEAELANAKFEKSTKTIDNSFPDINALMAINNFSFEEESNENKNKWILGGEFTPLYSYRRITDSENNNYNADYYNEGESPVMSYTGGLNLQFKPKDRLTIQAGVYYSSIGQSLDYMSVYSNQAYELVSDEFKDRFINSYELNNSAGDISFNTPYVIVDEIAGRVNNLSSEKGFVNTADPIFQDLDAEIQQSFQYIEVPVILRYKLIDKVVDLNIVGGIGANFLIGNDVLLVYGNNKEIIGETKGVNTVNYSSSLGLGIEYPLMKRLNIRLEPSIKYYLNSINSNSSVESHPYSIGIYTGINYTF